MATLGTAKTACNGKLLTAASTEDGSGFFNADTTAAAFATTFVEVAPGQQQRVKQANGSWAVNPYTISSTTAFKYLNNNGTSSTANSITFSSRNIGELILEYDGTNIQLMLLSQALGGFAITQQLPIVTQNTIPSLQAPWNGFGVPNLNINNTVVANGTLASTTSTAASTTSVIAVASATGISYGQLVTGTGVPANTTVVSVSGLNVTVSQAVNIATSAALTFASSVIFTSGSSAVTVTPGALGYNVNPGDSVTATFTS